ncbi:O-antigen ligase family protein [Paenibacillus sp. GCM10027628]|uniref:O-antigen ligase family protein n=1 Tax=Paenibacillus sp. GCM10027628 TaxID=3273413 RepID=UPI00362966BF
MQTLRLRGNTTTVGILICICILLGLAIGAVTAIHSTYSLVFLIIPIIYVFTKRPYLSFLFLLVLFPIPGVFISPSIHISLPISQLSYAFNGLVILLTIFRICKSLIINKNEKNRNSTIFNVLLAIVSIMLLYFTCSIFYSVDKHLGITYLLRLIIPFCMLFLAWDFCKEESKKNTLFIVISFTTAMQSILGILEYFKFHVVLGTFYHPANLTMFMGFGMLITLWLFMQSKKGRVFYLILLLINFIPFILAGERISWISFIISALILSSYRKRYYIFLGIVFTAIWFFGQELLASRIGMITSFQESGGFDTSNSVGWRFKIWGVIYNLALQNPFFGHGLGSSNSVVGSVYVSNAFAPHNEYLRLFFEVGVIGLLLFILVVVVIIFATLRIQKNMRILTIAVTAGYLVDMITDNIVIYPEVTMTCFVIIGACLSTHKQNSELKKGTHHEIFISNANQK